MLKSCRISGSGVGLGVVSATNSWTGLGVVRALNWLTGLRRFACALGRFGTAGWDLSLCAAEGRDLGLWGFGRRFENRVLVCRLGATLLIYKARVTLI